MGIFWRQHEDEGLLCTKGVEEWKYIQFQSGFGDPKLEVSIFTCNFLVTRLEVRAAIEGGK